jgi:hypothetical protein
MIVDDFRSLFAIILRRFAAIPAARKTARGFAAPGGLVWLINPAT